MTRVNKIFRVCVLFVLFAVAAASVICAAPYAVHAAAGGPNVSVTARPTGTAGEYEATVSIANNPGISVYNLALEFDNTKLTPLAITQGDTLTNGMVFASNLTQAETDEEKSQLNQVTAVWGAAEDATGDGALFSVVFRAETVVEEQTPIGISVNRILGAEEDVSATSTGTELTVAPAGGAGTDGAAAGIAVDGGANATDGSGGTETAVDSGFIGAPYELDDAGASLGAAEVNESAVPAASNANFGRPPQTGMPDIGWAVAGACISLAATVLLGAYLIHCRRKKGGNPGNAGT